MLQLIAVASNRRKEAECTYSMILEVVPMVINSFVLALNLDKLEGGIR